MLTRIERLKQKKDKLEAIGCGMFALLLVAVGILYLSFYN